MNEFLDQVWLGNPVRNYLIVVGIILFVILFRKFISRYVALLLFSAVHSVWENVDKRSFINLVMRPLGFFLSILVSIIALYKLRFPEVLDAEIYKYTLKQVLHSIGTIILIVAFIGLLLRIIDFIAIILEKKSKSYVRPVGQPAYNIFQGFF